MGQFSTGSIKYGTLGFNVPLDTVQVISGSINRAVPSITNSLTRAREW